MTPGLSFIIVLAITLLTLCGPRIAAAFPRHDAKLVRNPLHSERTAHETGHAHAVIGHGEHIPANVPHIWNGGWAMPVGRPWELYDIALPGILHDSLSPSPITRGRLAAPRLAQHDGSPRKCLSTKMTELFRRGRNP